MTHCNNKKYEPEKEIEGKLIAEVEYSCSSNMHYLTDFNEIKMYWTIRVFFDNKGITGVEYEDKLKVISILVFDLRF